MSTAAIMRRLAWAELPEGESVPSRAQIETWPKQARLICAGSWEQLRVYQEELIAKGEAPVLRAYARFNPATVRAGAYDFLLALFVVLLLLGLLTWVLSRHFGWCDGPEPGCEVVSTLPDPGTSTLTLSTDTLFDYNRAKPISDEHEARLAASIGAYMSQFGGVRILRISAHTDPIGGAAKNRELAVARAAYVEGMLQRLAQSPKFGPIFKANAPPATVANSEGPGAEDADIWRACASRFQYGPEKADRPLVDLSAVLNTDQRPLCSKSGPDSGTGGRYPACARPDGPFKPVAAENFRELTACLAPMRHVLVEFEHERQVVTPSTSCRVVIKKGRVQ